MFQSGSSQGEAAVSRGALVAGGTGGIGREVVRALAARGGEVAFTYRSAGDVASELADELPGSRPYRLDLADLAATAQVVAQVVQVMGGLRTLVYAAGPYVPMRHLSRVPPADLRAQFDADASLSAVPKAAVEAVVRGLAVEEGRFGVRANCVGPRRLSDGMAQRLVASGDIDDVALEAARTSRRCGAPVPPSTSRPPSRSGRRTRPVSSPARSWTWTAATVPDRRHLRTACIPGQHADVPDLHLSELATALNALTRLASSARFHDETVRATGVRLSRSGLRFLSLVSDVGPVSGSRLAESLDLSQPTASRTLQSLEAEGLVSRQASTSDGRVSHYVATPRGRRALQAVHAFHVSQLAEALREVEPDRRAALADAVTELVRHLHGDSPSSDRRTA